VRPRFWVIVGIAVLAVSLGGIAFAANGSGHAPAIPGAWARGLLKGGGTTPQAPAGTRETLRIWVHTQHQKLVDADGSGGFSVGDYTVFTETIFDRSHQPIGQDFVQCLFSYGPAECSGAFSLDGRGRIQIDGMLDHTDSAVAVIGGTGEFATASGIAVIHLSGTNTTQITFHVV
jgi:hypothetical protein